ncbi:MAG: M28 family peptidase [Clostridia bacterium]|nr:M28 family peptidase [Clostridia bacterium]
MTETTSEIFEKYQVRKTKAQKSAFAAYVEGLASDWGYSFQIEKGSFGAKNLVVGDPASAKVVYTAHYDTAPVLPFPNFITPKNFLIYILYNVAIVLGFFAVAFLLGLGVGFASAVFELREDAAFWIGEIAYFAMLFLMVAGPANKHTANDNTSGVTLLIDMMRELPAEHRDDVAFVFFDLEEMGLVGSSSFARAHKDEMKDRLLVNFDCVSDGENILFVLRQGAKAFRTAIETAFAETDGFKVEVADKGVFYPSDQAKFPCGIGVAALRSTKGGLLYMNRIHTNRDIIYREENIEFLKNGAIELLNLI